MNQYQIPTKKINSIEFIVRVGGKTSKNSENFESFLYEETGTPANTH